jgi:hypothetical protein
LFNLPPKELSYPAYFDGTWDTSIRYEDASFSPEVPINTLSRDVNVAGFRKYSVAYLPDVGSDFECQLKFTKQPSGLVAQDLKHNIRSILANSVSATADDIEYDPAQNANRYTVRYKDAKGSGKMELFTNFRSQGDTSRGGPFRTFESIRQASVRLKENKQPTQTMVVDYGIEWVLVPQQPTADGPVRKLEGTLKLVSYLIPQDDLYFIRPERPVGIFLYSVEMRRVDKTD